MLPTKMVLDYLGSMSFSSFVSHLLICFFFLLATGVSSNSAGDSLSLVNPGTARSVPQLSVSSTIFSLFFLFLLSSFSTR